MLNSKPAVRFARTVLSAAALVCLAPFALAEQAGEAEYLSACASCHGVNGEGGGPMNAYLSIAVPGLTGLAAANDGVFPMERVVEIIDGRAGVRGHGSEGMPVWGAVYESSATSQRGETPDMVARGRILSLAYYLQSIQK